MTYGKPPVSKAFTTIGCPSNSSNSLNNSTYEDLSIKNIFQLSNRTTADVENQPKILMIFQLSYLYYSPFAVFTVCLVGSIISLLTGTTSKNDLDRNLYIDVFKCFRKKSKFVLVNIFFIFLHSNIFKIFNLFQDHSNDGAFKNAEYSIVKSNGADFEMK